MEFSNLLVEVKDGLAFLTINRPDKLNALNHQTMQELKAAFESFAARDFTINRLFSSPMVNRPPIRKTGSSISNFRLIPGLSSIP